MLAPRSLAALVAASLPAVVSALYENGSIIAPCDSPLYCQGEILHQIELARPFDDSKTYVDMPTIKPLEDVIAAFNQLPKPLSNNTALHDFLTENFAPAGGELEAVPASELTTNPQFLAGVDSTVLVNWALKVIDIWPSLTRRYASASACEGCVDSFLEISRTFVVAGGRFREAYYWDSYWILHGLLRTEGSFTEIARNMIENFLDFVDMLGFVPNGSREYYRNRSQPPVLSAMVREYVEFTGDTSILKRALPLLVREHEWWMTNRTVEVEVEGEVYTLNRYAVRNTQPRPESYREDYITAANTSFHPSTGIIYPATPLTEEQQQEVYGHLASGAESGWDYSSRWLRTPQDAARENYFPLRSVNTMNTIPVDLNSLLYQAEAAIANLSSVHGNETLAAEFAGLAAKRQDAMTAVLWNETYFRYFDYNVTSGAHNAFVWADEGADPEDVEMASEEGEMLFWNAAQLYPFWTGAAPAHLTENPLAVLKAFEPVKRHLDTKAGAVPATNMRTGQQWDEPNVWPPLQHILMKGLLNTKPTFGTEDPAYGEVKELALRLGQRYVDSAFCTWYSTGGTVSSAAASSQGHDVYGTKAEEALEGVDGVMFEKYDSERVNRAGGGGEYMVVEGFGWTNGVVMWTLDEFGAELGTPVCPGVEGEAEAEEDEEEVCGKDRGKERHRGKGRGRGKRMEMGKRAVELDAWDAGFVKRFGRE